MRIVAVADTHTFQSDLGQLPDGDVFIHAGDMARAGTLEEMEPVAEWIRGLPHRHKIVVAGNHDWCFVTDRDAACALFGESVTYLQDQGCVIDGVMLWGSPWQPEFHDWAFNLPRGPALAERWSLIPDHVDVLITHGPPSGFGDRSWDSRAGCEDLLQAVYRTKPSLHPVWPHSPRRRGLARRRHLFRQRDHLGMRALADRARYRSSDSNRHQCARAAAQSARG